MTRMRHSTPTDDHLRKQRHNEAFACNHSNPTRPIGISRSRFGFNPTKSDLTETQVAIRRDTAMRQRRVKPSMPKMPWEDTK